MNVFVIGDVHGCFYSFKELVEKYWDPENELLIQLGDLIDRGRYNPETVAYARELEFKYPEKAIFLMGNHEFMAIEHLDVKENYVWLMNGGNQTRFQYSRSDRSFEEDVRWFKSHAFFWENEHIYVSHAGLSGDSRPLDPHNRNGVLWYRGPLKNITKLQIIGHTPTADGEADFREDENAVNIDTGAYMGKQLSGIKIDASGNERNVFSLKTHEKDVV